MTISSLRAEAEALAGRPLEVETLTTGKKVVAWMSFSSPPPPPGDTEEEALKNFIAHIQAHSPKNLPDVEDQPQVT